MDFLANAMYQTWYIWIPVLLLGLTHALAYRKGYLAGKSRNVSLAFYDAVMDALRDNGNDGRIEFHRLVELVDARSSEWDAAETEATLLAMRNQGIITIEENASPVQFQGRPVTITTMVQLATS